MMVTSGKLCGLFWVLQADFGTALQQNKSRSQQLELGRARSEMDKLRRQANCRSSLFSLIVRESDAIINLAQSQPTADGFNPQAA